MFLNCGAGEDSSDCQDIKAVHPKGNQFWIFIGRTDAEVEAPTFWPPDVKSWIIGEDPDMGKIEDKRRGGWQIMRWLDSITDSKDMNMGKLLEIVDREAWSAAFHGTQRHDLIAEQQQQHLCESSACNWKECVFCCHWVEYLQYVN